MSNVYQFSDFLSRVGVSGMRPGGLIWSPYHPQEAVYQRGAKNYGAGLLYTQYGLAYWNLAFSTIPALQGSRPAATTDEQLFSGYLLVQHIVKQDLDGLSMQDLAACQTLRQFITLAETRPSDLDRWSESERWPSGFDPHRWVQHLKRLT